MTRFAPGWRRRSIAAAAFAALHLGACAADPTTARGTLPQLPPATPAALVGACEELAARAAGLPQTTITASTTVPAGTLKVAGQSVAEHCRVTGKMNERVSPVDGRAYAISFEMRLPKDWNGRFFHQGNGGIDGNVTPATGSFGGGPLTNALLQGFAVLSSDAGHPGAYGPSFGLDPQARLDYGYQAVGTLTPMAKQLIALAYAKGPDRSYFGGCSNGGRHALVAAARYAADYDGFLAGAPGFHLPLAALANIFGAQRYASVATGNPATPAGLETAFTAAERRTVAAAVLQRCDALDGATDGLVQDTGRCQQRFNFMRDVPTCAGERDGSCLSMAQKIAIAPIFRGATTSNGERFYAGFPFDTGIAGGGIPFWEFTAPLMLDSGSVGVIFKVPPSTLPLTDGPAFSLGLDIDATLAQLHATDATYTEPAMGFMTPPNENDMSAVQRRGGKILVYHGVSDPIFSVSDTEAWYRRLGRDANQYAALYPVPGMGHCSGGPSTDQADFITPLVAWVEQGQAPGRLIASARGPGNPAGANAEVPAGWAPDRTRPLCPYPSVAQYDGQGDPERAASWTCREGH
jgi:pimeloyl-ACP methyl ester carboxylesterase